VNTDTLFGARSRQLRVLARDHGIEQRRVAVAQAIKESVNLSPTST